MALNKIERRKRIHYRIRKVVNGTPERQRMECLEAISRSMFKLLMT